jgi:hypothetical protein
MGGINIVMDLYDMSRHLTLTKNPVNLVNVQKVCSKQLKKGQKKGKENSFSPFFAQQFGNAPKLIQ